MQKVADSAVETRLGEIAAEIKASGRRVAFEVMVMGQRLIEAKGLLPHGSFESWVREECQITPRTAQNFMHVAHRFMGKSEIVSHLPLTVLYSLAAPSTPLPAVDEVITRVEAGEVLTPAQVEQTIDNHTGGTRVVKAGIRSGVRVAEEIAATQGFVSVNGESMAIEAAVTEDMRETQQRQTQHMVDKYEREAVDKGKEKYRGFVSVDYVADARGRVTLFSQPLVDTLKGAAGKQIYVIVYVKENQP